MIVKLAIKVGSHLEFIKLFGSAPDVGLDLLIGSGLVCHQFAHFTRVGKCTLNAVHPVLISANVRKLLHDSLRSRRIIPEAVSARALVELGYGAGFARVVKDAP
ncbi:MAG: hypothetical protein NVSMB31_12270 [Vulcanimicrobiaceae bacterium]